ncbi:PREDICTED: cell wall / vacuolar inhibitor of fructosidase 1 [Tarenaya hassleriana]|uniref:cell wall / vacuolar inhibitor of fructosidase 1 n=1 Tax=Tarenaya hassleriana TaxID=28532 RepID=UPI00053C541D|nr:PREDICTED: cell wall / vacuolar inhibitor of fructosidase 1 [Tarenaya hassleriana]
MRKQWCLFGVAAVVVMTMMSGVRSDEVFIEKTCKQTPNYNLCVSLLKSDPRGSSADTTGLALILVDHIKATATETLKKISRLYKKRRELREPLVSCTSKYKAILEADVPSAVEALSKGVPKYAEDAVVDAGVEASICERGFHGKSPLTALTKSLEDISDVARPIVRMLL